MFEKFVRWLSRILGILAAMSIVILMLAITLDVIVRFITRSSLPGMLELAESSLVVAVFLGLAWAGVEGAHVAVELVVDRLPAKARSVLNVVVWALSTAILAWMVYGTTTKAVSATGYREERFGLVRWPLYPWRWVIVIGLTAFLLVAIVNLIRTIKGKEPLGEENTISSVDPAHPTTPETVIETRGY